MAQSSEFYLGMVATTCNLSIFEADLRKIVGSLRLVWATE